MAGEFEDPEFPRFTALYVGTVFDRADPQGVGRVRVKIPGLVDPATDWAFPLGVPFGGQAQRGFFSPPELGAAVGVLFNQGDVDEPYYFSGWWGAPGGQNEVPTGATVTSNGDNKVFESGAWRIDIDDRPASLKLKILDKTNFDEVTIDAVTREVLVKTTKVILDAGTIELGAGASEALVLGNSFRTFLNTQIGIFNAHIHPDPISGFSGPPTTTMTTMSTSLLSLVTFTN